MDSKTTKRSRMLLRVRKRGEDVARRQYGLIVARLRDIEKRLGLMTRALADYDAAARRALMGDGAPTVLGTYRHRTVDIRKAIVCLRGSRTAVSPLFQRCRRDLLEAHKQRQAAEEYHRRVMRAADAENQRGVLKEVEDIYATRAAGQDEPRKV
ncbi:MAG: hypothetical protein QF577_09900 [Phycisphaerae bacterium]|nr:hypothetical protein [Phycisphaerae bacterium]MDP7637844.1 hypothetical protein [Phycisphaerae bacterium]